MNLDMRTMLIMLAVLSFMLSVILALASLNDRGIRGLKHWSAASFMLFLGFNLALFRQSAEAIDGVIVIGAALIVAGTSLQLIGIQAFNGQKCQWRLLFLATLLATAQSVWFIFVDPDINMRAVGNSFLLMILNLACAKSLLGAMSKPERTARWVTGLSFLVLSAIHLTRVVAIIANPDADYGLYQKTPINPMMFFTGGIAHLLIAFGFILMVNYRLSAELDELAATDSLTGVWNRRSLEQYFALHLTHSSRHMETLSVIMFDIDRFKNINDTYGHRAGDEVLRHLSAIAKTEIRRDDCLARYGGEEFCLLLPATNETEARILAERLRLAYLNRPPVWQNQPLDSSISLGIACSQRVGLDRDVLLEAADAALYEAKHSGRNKSVLYTQSSLQSRVPKISHSSQTG